MFIEILTFVLVVITGFYAWATFKILKANERVVEVMHEQAEAITRPYVSVALFLELDNPIFYLRITNTGKSAALNLRLTLDKAFFKFGEKSGDKNLASFSAFNQPIDSFPPGSEIIFSLAQSFIIFAEDADRNSLPTNFCVTAEYSYGNRSVKEDNLIDLRPYYNAAIPQNAYIRKLKDISESLKKVAEGINRKP